MAVKLSDSTSSGFESQISRWEDEDVELLDAVCKHFEHVEPQMLDWIDVAAEGRRLWGVAFGEQVEEHSAVDEMLNGVAASAWDLAINRVASFLNISADDIQEALMKHITDKQGKQ